MSVELYPDHKAILHFQDSLKVYEIDFLDYLTAYLASDLYEDRHFDIYVKPTLHHSAFDFIIVEPHHAIYTIQTPETLEEYQTDQAALDYFYHHRLHSLSPTLAQNIQQSVQDDEMIKNALNTPLVYHFEEELTDEFSKEKAETDVFITGKDFLENTEILQETFKQRNNPSFKLTPKETAEIKRTLNPNTNIKHYIPKSMPKEYHEKTTSRPQTKQKFKGSEGSGKTLVLTKRAIQCSNRLNNNGRILVIAGDTQKVRALKDIITAESAKSLQELGMDVVSYQELLPTDEKYQALFIDDGHYLEVDEYEDLLENFLVPMTDAYPYEYVVMVDSDYKTTVPQIFGRFIQLKYDLRKMTQMLNESRSVFLDILSGS